MRKRIYLIGAVAAVSSLAFAGAAQAAITYNDQQLDVNTSAGKLDKKKAGAVNSLFVDVITPYTGSGLPIDKRATNTKVYFPKDFQFRTTGLAQCDPNAPNFGTGTTEQAKAACGPAQVGDGSAALVGAVAGVTAVVTAFNGTQPAGMDTILLHSRTTAGTTTVLIGTLMPSNIGGFGKMLDVPVPILLGGSFAISDFRVTIPKVQLPGKAASSAKKKKKKPKKYYVMAKCSKKKWNFRADSTYDNATTSTASDQTTCKQKKAKKKKK
ncbi:MAG: hypothetical protein F9K44_16775 [Hyphomicrobiaceae bacterium]|nr:MAG: hypothetical protein F9K44_16775 [Hyphomicrobiaceae bacterium]